METFSLTYMPLSIGMINGTKIRPGMTKKSGLTMRMKVELYFYPLCTVIWDKSRLKECSSVTPSPDVKHIDHGRSNNGHMKFMKLSYRSPCKYGMKKEGEKVHY